MSELKPLPCPYCGRSTAIICETPYQGRPSFAVSCRTELCHGAAFQLGYGYYATEQEAITEWNRRASPWIRFEDRKPEEGQHVIISNAGRSLGSLYYYSVDNVALTHWMTIPKVEGNNA